MILTQERYVKVNLKELLKNIRIWKVSVKRGIEVV